MIRVILLMFATVCAAVAQPATPDTGAQREAMKKLEFLVGRWAGDATVIRGPGEPLRIHQSEEIQYKLGGLVLLVEGTGRNAAGEVVFQAMATISYDDASKSYRFRSHSDGRYVETEIKVSPTGFSWGFAAGPAKVNNTMRLTEKGEWAEVTEVTFGANPPRKSVEMLLKKQQ